MTCLKETMTLSIPTFPLNHVLRSRKAPIVRYCLYKDKDDLKLHEQDCILLQDHYEKESEQAKASLHDYDFWHRVALTTFLY